MVKADPVCQPEKEIIIKKVHILSQKIVFNDKFKILETRLQFEKFNGQMSPPVRRLTFERGDAAAALLWHRDRQRLLLVEQFRSPTYKKGPGWIIGIGSRHSGTRRRPGSNHAPGDFGGNRVSGQ